jgi:hypothetical protein
MAYERMLSAARRLIEECGTTAFDLAIERAHACRAAKDIHTARLWVTIALTICELESGSCTA